MHVYELVCLIHEALCVCSSCTSLLGHGASLQEVVKPVLLYPVTEYEFYVLQLGNSITSLWHSITDWERVVYLSRQAMHIGWQLLPSVKTPHFPPRHLLHFLVLPPSWPYQKDERELPRNITVIKMYLLLVTPECLTQLSASFSESGMPESTNVKSRCALDRQPLLV